MSFCSCVTCWHVDFSELGQAVMKRLTPRERLGEERYAKLIARRRERYARDKERQGKQRKKLPQKTCLNCDIAFVPPRRDALFCGERCRQIAEHVRYARRKVSEGTFERPDIWEAIFSRLNLLVDGFYDKRGARFVPDEVRQALRSSGQCSKCSCAFEAQGERRFTVQHLNGVDGFLVEGWCYRCNMDHALSIPRNLLADDKAFLDEFFARARAPRPKRPCDDEIDWAKKWRRHAATPSPADSSEC